MAKIDHHLHTTRYSPDSVIEPEELIAYAQAAGLDAVVITEHDAQWSQEELEEINARSEGVLILSGAEISTREGHFLVYGLPDLDETPPGITVGELIQVVRAHQGAIVAAHPYRWGQDFDSILDEHGPVFDALEFASNNVTPDFQPFIRAALDRFKMGSTGSSDAHVPETIGCYYSEFRGPIRSMKEFVAAVRGRSSRPRHRPGAVLVSGPVE